MTHYDITEAVSASLEDRVRDAIRGVLEEVMEEEITDQLQAKHRERTERPRGERNGHYERALTTAAGHVEQIRVPRARELQFLIEVFERYRRMSGSLEEAVLEMYLQGVSTRKVEAITGKRISKDAVTRIAGRCAEAFAEWRGRQLDRERSYPYLYLDATYLKARWARAFCDVALLVAVSVNDEGFRKVLAVEAVEGERSETWRGLLQGLVGRGLCGAELVIPYDHDLTKQAVQVELSGSALQRCTAHFQRNVLAHVPQAEAKAVGADLTTIFHAEHRETSEQLAASFSERYREVFPKGRRRALARARRGANVHGVPVESPAHSHHHGLERVFREVKRRTRTRIVDVFPNERSAETLATAVLLVRLGRLGSAPLR